MKTTPNQERKHMTSSRNISGDQILVLSLAGQRLTTIPTYCPDTGIKRFFADNPRVNQAIFILQKRVKWDASAPSEPKPEFVDDPIGTFERRQVEAAVRDGKAAAQVIEMPQDRKVEAPKRPVSQATVEAAGKSCFARAKELAAAGASKGEANKTLQAEFPAKNPKALRGMIHSVWAQFAPTK